MSFEESKHIVYICRNPPYILMLFRYFARKTGMIVYEKFEKFELTHKSNDKR
jgi:hypothetical protein